MDSTSRKESLAHFYRECSVWPRLNPTLVLTAAPQLIQSSTRVEGKKVILTASVHRTTWVAGQQCFVKVQVQNLSRKTIKKIKFALVRTTTVFKSRPTPSDSTTWRTTTTRKEVAEEILEIAQRGAKGYASARGWFFGVEPDQSANLSHSIVIPVSTSSPHFRLSWRLSSPSQMLFRCRMELFSMWNTTYISPFQLIPASLFPSPSSTSSLWILLLAQPRNRLTETQLKRVEDLSTIPYHILRCKELDMPRTEQRLW